MATLSRADTSLADSNSAIGVKCLKSQTARALRQRTQGTLSVRYRSGLYRLAGGGASFRWFTSRLWLRRAGFIRGYHTYRKAPPTERLIDKGKAWNNSS
jgi:hypothetical protein